jgi:DNA-binding LytR/AlgR family response regulator
MIKVAIVEDDEKYAKTIKEFLERFSNENKVELALSHYPNGFSFLEANKDVDIALLDIEMPGMNGMEVAKALRKNDQHVCIVFVTNMAQYALKGYEVGARYYIIKPISYFDFSVKLQTIVSYIEAHKGNYIYIKTNDGIAKIDASDILYLESEGHSIHFHTANGVFTKRLTMEEAKKAIGSFNFASCAKSFYINLDYVSNISKNNVYVGGAVIPISRLQRKAFIDAVTKYMGGSMI